MVRALALPRRDERLVLGGNLLRLIRRVHRRPTARSRITDRTATSEAEIGEPWAGHPFSAA